MGRGALDLLVEIGKIPEPGAATLRYVPDVSRASAELFYQKKSLCLMQWTAPPIGYNPNLLPFIHMLPIPEALWKSLVVVAETYWKRKLSAFSSIAFQKKFGWLCWVRFGQKLIENQGWILRFLSTMVTQSESNLQNTKAISVISLFWEFNRNTLSGSLKVLSCLILRSGQCKYKNKILPTHEIFLSPSFS